MTAEELYDKLTECFDDVRIYSGRSMYGAECPGFVVESGTELWEVASFVGYEPDERVRCDLVEVFRNARIDQMGQDNIIVYFPRLKFEEPEAA